MADCHKVIVTFNMVILVYIYLANALRFVFITQHKEYNTHFLYCLNGIIAFMQAQWSG